VAAADHDDIELLRHGSTWNKSAVAVILSGAKNLVHDD